MRAHIRRGTGRRARVAGIFLAILAGLSAQTDPGPVDMSNRESARIWFNTWWPKTNGAPMGFTGNIDAGIPGDISPAYRDETLLRFNIFRRMVGEQPVVLSAAYNSEAQIAAAICAANDDLQHNPPPAWKFYSATALTACQNNELTSSSGPHGIVDFMTDFGPNNLAVGHRGNILVPELQTVGIGSTPGHPNSPLSLGVLAFDDKNPSVGLIPLQIDGPFVMWPAKGYIPFYLFPGRWSAEITDSFTTGVVQFTGSIVAVSRDGQALPVKYVARNGGSGVIFTLDGTSEGSTGFVNTIVNNEILNGLPVQAKDVTYHVTISNITVRASGALWNGTGIYEYDVVGYNPGIAIATPGQQSNLLNISTRSLAGSGSNTQIAGFIIQGTTPRKILIRAGGPYLTQFGVDNVLSDPLLTLFAGTSPLLINDDWSNDEATVASATAKANAVAFATGSKDSAIVATLQPGVAYTAQVTGKGSATGNAIVEVYDVDEGAASQLVNISTRSFVGTGASIQIGGFILHGAGPRKVLIRAGGPYLSQFGVGSVLADPILTIFKGTTQIAQNDDWVSNGDDVMSATLAVNAKAFASGSADSAIVLTLDPDVAYTAQVSGKNGATGNALIEVYSVP